MHQNRRQNNSYILLNFLHYTALFAVRPYLSLIAADYGASVFVVGAITSLYSISQVLWAMPLGRILDRYGTSHAIKYGAAAFFVAALGLSFGQYLSVVIVCAVLIGLAHVTILLSVQHKVTGVAQKEKQEQYIGLIAFTASAGSFLGPLIGGYMRDRLGSGRGFIGAAVVCLASLMLTMLISGDQTPVSEQPKHSMTELLRDSNIMRSVLVSGTVLFTTEVTLSYLPLYCAEIGISAMTIGTIMSVKGIAQMVIRPFLKSMIKIFRRDRLLILCLILGGIFVAAYGLVRTSWMFFIIAALAGLSIGLAMPLTLLAVSIAAPSDQRSQVLALRIMGNYLGQSISPLVFGLIGQFIGLAPVFWISGLAMALSSKIVRYKR